MEWVVALMVVLFVAEILLFYYHVYIPLKRLRRLSRNLAKGAHEGGYIAKGAFGIDEIIQGLEMADARLAHLSHHVSMEKFNLKGVLTGMVEGVLVVDPEGRIQIANAQLEKMFSLSESPVDQTVMEALRHAEVQSVIEEVSKSGGPLLREIVLETLEEGVMKLRVMEMSAVQLDHPISDSKSGGIVAVFHDITRIKQLESVRKDFVANVSHELRTPLSIFQGYLETLLDNQEWLDPQAQRIVEVLKRNSTRLNSLVKDLLALSRLESGSFQIFYEEVEVGTYLSHVGKDWERRFNEKSATLDFAGETKGVFVKADPMRLDQVFNNLLENALMYSSGKEEPRVTIGTRPEGDTLLFFVRDNGIGIPSNKLPHIFSRFYRVDTARSRQFGGTGLGLAIVKHIIQIHGGEVWAESEVDVGSTIFFRLPAGGVDQEKPSVQDEFL